MRKILAIATFLGVGVLSIFSMSREAFANINATIASTSQSSVYGNSVKVSANGGFIVCMYEDNVLMSGINPAGLVADYYAQFYFTGDSPIGDLQPISNGSYRIDFYGYTVFTGCNGVPFQSIEFIWDNGYVAGSDTSTHFISFTPPGGTLVATSTATTTGFSLYVSADDWNSSFNTVFNLSYYPEVGPIESVFFDGLNNVDLRYGSEALALPGPNTFSTTTDLSRPGKYIWSVKVEKDKGFWAGLIIGGTDIVMASTSEFWVGEIYSPRQEGINEFQSRLEELMASSTYAVGASCSPLSPGFDFGNCLADIMYPGVDALREDLVLIKQMPPWGYLFRVYDIFDDVASSSLPVISATVPPGIIGSGAVVTLDPNNALDFVLNATSGVFVSGNATSTDSFFTITNRYWSYLVYIGFALYILFRIIGVRKLKL